MPATIIEQPRRKFPEDPFKPYAYKMFLAVKKESPSFEYRDIWTYVDKRHNQTLLNEGGLNFVTRELQYEGKSKVYRGKKKKVKAKVKQVSWCAGVPYMLNPRGVWEEVQEVDGKYIFVSKLNEKPEDEIEHKETYQEKKSYQYSKHKPQ